MMKQRCHWCLGSELYIDYHDKEWGVPLYDDKLLFELLNLEGMQAGLSWITILKKRENYRKAFDNFDAKKIVKYNERKIASLLADAGIIRNRLKILAIIKNAEAFLNFEARQESFSDYIWSFVDGKPLQNSWHSHAQIPSKTEHSDKLSKSLLKHGFKFVGSTICYAFMQAAGLINDHVTDCYRYKQLNKV